MKPPIYNPLAMSSLVYANEYAKRLKKYLKKQEMKITVQSHADQKAYHDLKVKEAKEKMIENEKKRKERDGKKR